MRVQVRKCPYTGKIFEEKDIGKYMIHLRNIREARHEANHLTRVKDSFATWLLQERTKIISIDEIAPWFMDNQRHIMDAHNSGISDRWGHSTRDKFHKNDRFENINLVVNYNHFISNSHTCPDNGVTNFSQTNDKPISYRGYSGRISGSLKRSSPLIHGYPYSNAINIVGIKTMSGGGGNDEWGYGVNIFLDDWPGIKNVAEGFEIIARLKGIK